MNEAAKYEANNQPMTLSRDFASVLQIIEQNRSQAVQMINHASVLTAWQVGAFVSDRIKNAAWGSKVVQQLAEYIHTQNPTLKGWSRMNIYRMVKFYETYSSAPFVERATSLKLLPKSTAEIVPMKMAQIVSTPLIQNGHNIIVSFEMAQIPSVLPSRVAVSRGNRAQNDYV